MVGYDMKWWPDSILGRFAVGVVMLVVAYYVLTFAFVMFVPSQMYIETRSNGDLVVPTQAPASGSPAGADESER